MVACCSSRAVPPIFLDGDKDVRMYLRAVEAHRVTDDGELSQRLLEEDLKTCPEVRICGLRIVSSSLVAPLVTIHWTCGGRVGTVPMCACDFA